MTATEVMSELERAGTAQNRKVYARHGARGEMFGVSFAKLRELKKKIRTDQSLAEALWETGNMDARMLAVMVADPESFGKRDLDSWMRQIDYYTLADVYVKEVVAKSPHARDRLDKWIETDHEWIGRAGWVLLANLAMDADCTLTDEVLGSYIERIEKEIHTARNLTRDAMNSALIAIGIRNENLRKRATAAATRIGKVVVDHGETACKTPDAVPYMDRAWQRRKK